MAEWIWIEDEETLRENCERWQTLDHIALDTEFIREKTFFPIAALIQINDGNQNYLIDPTVIDDLMPLRQLLSRSETIKVMHSCSEDLEVFSSLLDCHVEPLADTQVASAVLGISPAIGYANLCRELLNFELDKGETRSNWLQRPLTEAQCHYAAIDVEHLLPIFDILVERLENTRKIEIFEQECERIEQLSMREDDLSLSYLKIKAAWKMSPVELNRLRALSAWREHAARLRDIPRAHVIKDNGLIALTQKPPKTLSDFNGLDGVSASFTKKYGEAILTKLKEVAASDSKDYPKRMDKPLSKMQTKLLSQLRTALQEMAEKIGLAPELLANKRDAEVVVRAETGNKTLDLSYLVAPWRMKAYQIAIKQVNFSLQTHIGVVDE
jgi:ribonuclease D